MRPMPCAMPVRSGAPCVSAPRSCATPSGSSCTCNASTTASASPPRISSACSRKDLPPSPRKPITGSVCTGAPTRSARSAGGAGAPAAARGAAPHCTCWCRSPPVTPLWQEPPEVLMAERNTPIRVLVVDDEPEIRDAYKQILCDTEVNLEMTGFHELRSRLFRKNPMQALKQAANRATTFEPVFCEQADQAVAAVKEALARNEPFAVAFLDMRMPPGRDGVWAATQIRELDPAIEIVICTAYSDADPGEIGGYVPPEDKLSYLQKPFHPHEVRQMTIALGSKWRAERRIVRLAYFDTLTGLPNREQSRNRLIGALQAAKEKNGLLAVLYLDLDNFKRVNDTLGHAVGDQLLCVVADRLRTSLRYGGESSPGGGSSRPGDIARLGGDEFMVLLPNLRSTVDAGGVAERLGLGVRHPNPGAPKSLVG